MSIQAEPTKIETVKSQCKLFCNVSQKVSGSQPSHTVI